MEDQRGNRATDPRSRSATAGCQYRRRSEPDECKFGKRTYLDPAARSELPGRTRIAIYRAGERAERGELILHEAATHLGVSKMTVIRLIKAGSLPAQQVCPGAPYVIRQDDLNRPSIHAWSPADGQSHTTRDKKVWLINSMERCASCRRLGRAGDQQVLLAFDPFALREPLEHGSVETAMGAVIDILRGSHLAQPGEAGRLRSRLRSGADPLPWRGRGV